MSAAAVRYGSYFLDFNIPGSPLVDSSEVCRIETWKVECVLKSTHMHACTHTCTQALYTQSYCWKLVSLSLSGVCFLTALSLLFYTLLLSKMKWTIFIHLKICLVLFQWNFLFNMKLFFIEFPNTKMHFLATTPPHPHLFFYVYIYMCKLSLQEEWSELGAWFENECSNRFKLSHMIFCFLL